MPALVAASTAALRVDTAGGRRMPGTSPGMTWGCSTARAQIHLTAKCPGCCASNPTQHALVERSIVPINRKQWSAPTSGCFAMGEGARGEQDFHRLRSLLYFPVFLQKPRRARPHARARNEKPGAACRPGSWRSFGEYALLEDSRYTSQAENRAAIKPLN
jgi:hypothetical protein